MGNISNSISRESKEGKILANDINRESRDSEILADRMSKEKIEVYLKIAGASMSKSVFMIVMGSLLGALGLFLLPILSWFVAQGIITPPSPSMVSSISLKVTAGFYLAIGIYLMVQGTRCLVEARSQFAVMSEALQIKRFFTKKESEKNA